MGRYKGKITHSFSKDPTRPTFVQTLEEARLIYVNHILSKMTPEEQREFVRLGIQEGLIKEEVKLGIYEGSIKKE